MRKRNPDGTYGPTERGHYYRPVHYHAPTAAKTQHKTRWCIKEGEQYDIFRIANEPWWFCETDRCLFSIAEGQLVIGEDGQRLAKFPSPSNQDDPWHGWPVFSGDSKPDPELLDRWQLEGVVPYHVRLKIEKGKL